MIEAWDVIVKNSVKTVLKFYGTRKNWVIRSCDHGDNPTIDQERFPDDHDHPWTAARTAQAAFKNLMAAMEGDRRRLSKLVTVHAQRAHEYWHRIKELEAELARLKKGGA